MLDILMPDYTEKHFSNSNMVTSRTYKAALTGHLQRVMEKGHRIQHKMIQLRKSTKTGWM